MLWLESQMTLVTGDLYSIPIPIISITDSIKKIIIPIISLTDSIKKIIIPIISLTDSNDNSHQQKVQSIKTCG